MHARVHPPHTHTRARIHVRACACLRVRACYEGRAVHVMKGVQCWDVHPIPPCLGVNVLGSIESIIGIITRSGWSFIRRINGSNHPVCTSMWLSSTVNVSAWHASAPRSLALTSPSLCYCESSEFAHTSAYKFHKVEFALEKGCGVLLMGRGPRPRQCCRFNTN